MICISLIISDDKYLFMYLLAIWKSSLKKCLFHFPSHFFSCIVWFFIELQKFFLFILILYQIYYSQQFSPILWVPFLLWWLFLLFYRAFLFDTVPLVEFCFYCLCFWCHIQKIIAQTNVKEACALKQSCSFLKSLMEHFKECGNSWVNENTTRQQKLSVPAWVQKQIQVFLIHEVMYKTETDYRLIDLTYAYQGGRVGRGWDS